MTSTDFQDFVKWHFDAARDALLEYGQPHQQTEIMTHTFSVLTESLRIVRHEIDLADAPLREEIDRIKRLHDDPATAGEAERLENDFLRSLIAKKRAAQGIVLNGGQTDD